MMAQTRIDQFYRVISSNKKSESVKDNVKKSKSNIRARSPVIGGHKMKRRRVSGNSNISPVYNNKQNKMHSNISLSSRISPSQADTSNDLIKITGSSNKTVISPIAKHISPDIIYIGSQQRTVSYNDIKSTPKILSPINVSESQRAKIQRNLFKDRTENNPTKIIEDKAITSPTIRCASPDIVHIENQQCPVSYNDTWFTPKVSSSINGLFKDRIENNPIKIIDDKTVMSPIKYTSPDIAHIESQQCTVSHNHTTFTPKVSSPIGRSPIKYTSPDIVHIGSQCTVSHNRTKFTPKVSSPISRSPCAKIVRRNLFNNRNEELISAMISNLNLAKEGAIANNDINLEKVYSSKRFNYNYNPIDTTISTRYEINDVVVPKDRYSLHFFLAIVTVFSKPVNCGYFDLDELDLIFSMITLRSKAQALLIRMLKRKHMWHRINHIKYDEISDDLKPIFDELISRSIFKSNTDEEDISVLLNLLQVDEIHKLCQELKISEHKKKKDIYIQSILTFCKTKSLFPGMVTPATKLRASINKRLGGCILLNDRVKELVDRIITLLIPNRDPTETLVDVFRTLWNVEANEIKFPEVTISDLPIFASKGHLLDYIEAKSTLTNVLTAIEKKQWENVRNFGNLAAQRLPLFLQVESESFQDSSLPHHIRHFTPGYIWLKVLSKSIDVFKKTEETKPLAIKFLRMLIDQNCHMKHRKGQWYSELIKIEMYHRKDLEASVALLSEVILNENLTEVDRLDLLDRTKLIEKRKRVNKSTKDIVKCMLNNDKFNGIQLTCQSSKTIEGTLCGNTSQRKSNWCISKDIDQVYGSVESLALYHYKSEGYIKGVHCEGAFPITLFATLFWNEIYNINIPGAWVSLYQDAPLDLYTSEFYENRKEEIDKRLQDIRSYDSETLSKHLQNEFELHSEYRSISQSNFNSNILQEIAFCLGVEGVVGICQRLIYNYSLWKAGFPDLIVWNINTKQYKIVEVKGPKDSLSTKQKLWLDYLNRLGLNTEVCYCESNASHSKRRKQA